jgi:outer membrane lipoprotein
MRCRLLFYLLLLATLPGCVRAISDETRKLVDPAVTFAALKADPTPYMGRHIMVGGRIAAVKNTGEGGQLEIVQFDIDDSGVPLVNGRSGGRFLAVSVDFLDSMVYKPGRMITLVGEVKGKKSVPLDELDYTYPVLAIRETHLWRMTEYDQLLFTPAPYYDPYYFDNQQSPYWYRQFAPEPLKRPGVRR